MALCVSRIRFLRHLSLALCLLGCVYIFGFHMSWAWGCGSSTTMIDSRQLKKPSFSDLRSNRGAETTTYDKNFVFGHRSLDVLNGNSIQNSSVRHIGYLKVHKAGSTTLQNMLIRYAIRNNLILALPIGSNYFSRSRDSHNKLLPLPAGVEHYDMIACHSVFNPDVYASVLPVDSVYLAIVRDPLDVMVSAAYYYRDVWRQKYLRQVPKESFIPSLIKEPEKYDPLMFSHTKNTMARDFGFEWRPYNDTEISEYLNYINQSFKLVLVLERFDESIILMKRLLRLELKDVLYIQTNDHDHTSPSLDAGDMRLFKKRNYLDVAIYEYFRAELERKLFKSGPDFQEELQYFKAILKRLYHFCIGRKKSSDSLRFKPSRWNSAFSVRRQECQIMSMKERFLIQKMRVRHLYMTEGDFHYFSMN